VTEIPKEGLTMCGTSSNGDSRAQLEVELQALVGSRLIYEEGRDFMAVELLSVDVVGEERTQLKLSLKNLSLPGFASHFPPAFIAGGEIDTISRSPKALSAYMGIWTLATDPVAVKTIVACAATEPSRQALLKECRRVVYGYER
jgi:hypothetical protein